MAQAFAERAAARRVPPGHMRKAISTPEVVEAMREIGSISAEGSSPLTDEDVEWPDLVVTMGCGDACPVLPGKRYIDWKLLDPGPGAESRWCARSRRDRRLVAELATSGTGRIAATASSWFAW